MFFKEWSPPSVSQIHPSSHLFPQVRSLANYCFDLRFHRPRVEQIKAAVLSITCKEHVTIPPYMLTEIIEASNQDIRQVCYGTSLCVCVWIFSSSFLLSFGGQRLGIGPVTSYYRVLDLNGFPNVKAAD